MHISTKYYLKDNLVLYQVPTLPMVAFNPKSNSKLRSALHFSLSLNPVWNSFSLVLFSLSIYKIALSVYLQLHTCSAPFITIDNVNTVCEYVIMRHNAEHIE